MCEAGTIGISGIFFVRNDLIPTFTHGLDGQRGDESCAHVRHQFQ